MPRARVRVRMLAPVRLPKDRSWVFLIYRVMAMAISGKEVPIEIRVRPIRKSGMPIVLAMLMLA